MPDGNHLVPPTILIIGDDDNSRLQLLKLVQSVGWYGLGYTSGQMYLRTRPDLGADCLLLDLFVPEDGLALLRALRALGVQTPVVAMADSADVDMIGPAREAGISEVLWRPAKQDMLQEALRRAIAGHAGAEGLSIGLPHIASFTTERAVAGACR